MSTPLRHNSRCCAPYDEQDWHWIPTTPPKGNPCIDFGYDDQEWVADWGIGERGELAADNQLHSAVIMQLFTDKRLPADQDTLIRDPFERGGWWGDYFAPFEMGSLLWTLYRAPLTDATIQDAERYCREAIQPLIDQGAVARQLVTVQADKLRGYLYILIDLFAADGARIYQQQFSRFWN